jgi:hypothetical protein
MQEEKIKAELRSYFDKIATVKDQILKEGKIPQIEIDILMENVRAFYETLHLLNKHNQEQPQPTIIPANNYNLPEELIAETNTATEVDLKTEEKEIHPVTSKVEEQPKAAVEPEINIAVEEVKVHKQPDIIIAQVDTSVVEPATEISRPEVMPQATLAAERTKEFNKPAQKSKSIGSLFDETPTLAKTYSGAPTVYDKIGAEKEDKSIGSKLQNNPVTDLRKSIGINEKFSFINELFDGDLTGYNDAIDKLNSSENHQQAVSMLSDVLASKYQWSTDGKSYMQLRNLIDRRFGA